MKVSEMLTQPEWEYIFDRCMAMKVNPKLIAAIGWHETHWGRLGMGRHGYFFGVSCWTRTQAQYNSDKAKGTIDPDTYSKTAGGHLYCLLPYKGIEAQLKWALDKLAGFIPFNPDYADVLRVAKEVWKPGNPEAWAQSVYSIYQDLVVDLSPSYVPTPLPEGPGQVPTIEGEMPQASGLIQRIIYYLERIIDTLKQWQ